uniref:NADH dehydrogenase subunit 3 n=1 Tax=Xestocephalus gracilus TaxID=3112137 RepID=UPI002E769A27|nr:NADH dehydrogenase subunit 3 [Xestocephalus gracilus]WRK21303.1 NADH dehydrogenase subunit 3 [Xestocephalus gracilus]
MNQTIKFTSMIMMVLLLLMLMITAINMKSTIEHQKSTPFECGFNPISHSRTPLSIKFFLIGVLFLIFDIEVIIIMPMIFTMKSSMLTTWMLTSLMMIMILIMGLYHEWYNGLLNWTK